jgi:spermidine synthase
MAVELLGARLLSVAFGGSLSVWAGMISVTLLSLAIGYYLGGRLADRWPRPALLYAMLLTAALLVALCPFARPVLKPCYYAFGLQWGAVTSSAAIFFLPLLLLGMTGPFIIRLLSEGGRGVGTMAGCVYAVSTLGSVAGTLLSGLWLIPAWGTTPSFQAAGIAMAGVAGVGLVLGAGRRGAAALPVLAALALLPAPRNLEGLAYRAPDGDAVQVVAERDSAYGHMVVLHKGKYRLLVVNGIVQTGVPDNLARLEKGQLLLTQYYQELIPYLVDDPAKARVLVIGLAGGMTASLLQRYGMDPDCVDIDAGVIDLARRHFGFTGRARAADGRQFLETCDQRYDFCVMDTYSGDVFPFQLATKEAFESVRRVLNPNGTLVMNYIGAPGGPAFAALVRTVREVFPETLAIRGENSGDVQTITLFASARRIEFNNGWLDHLGGFSGVDPVSQAISRLTVAPQLAGAPVLTDERNPIDLLRGDEARRWRARTLENIGAQAIF